MKCSLGELQALLLKASVGAGLPVGLAEEIALAGRWLLANGFDGLGAALKSIEYSPQWPQTPSVKGGEAVFEDARTAVCGSAVLDLLKAGVCRKARLRNPDSPLLFIGLAGVATVGAGTGIAIESVGEMRAVLREGRVFLAGDVPDSVAELSVVCEAPSRHDWRQAISVAQGVDVATKKLGRLEELASRTYVPANDVSRESGAGAGRIDNE